MKVGVVYPQTELKGDPQAVHRIGLATEELGYNHLLSYDHPVGASHDREPKLAGPYTDQDPFHDPFMMFSYLAGITERIELATGCLILPQRQTVLVAKQAADLDLLSDGRVRLGVGVGWNYVEYQALGQDFSTRGARANEQIGLLRRLWTEPLVTFTGIFDRVEKANINPRPKRCIPIWIGGFSEVAARRAAKFGDGFIFAGELHSSVTLAGGLQQGDVRGQLAVVRRCLEDEGRSEDGFGFDFIIYGARTPKAVAETIEAWRNAGGTHASVVTMGLGFTSIDEHIGYLRSVRELI